MAFAQASIIIRKAIFAGVSWFAGDDWSAVGTFGFSFFLPME
jgi:hypothetical protein